MCKCITSMQSINIYGKLRCCIYFCSIDRIHSECSAGVTDPCNRMIAKRTLCESDNTMAAIFPTNADVGIISRTSTASAMQNRHCVVDRWWCVTTEETFCHAPGSRIQEMVCKVCNNNIVCLVLSVLPAKGDLIRGFPLATKGAIAIPPYP